MPYKPSKIIAKIPEAGSQAEKVTLHDQGPFLCAPFCLGCLPRSFLHLGTGAVAMLLFWDPQVESLQPFSPASAHTCRAVVDVSLHTIAPHLLAFITEHRSEYQLCWIAKHVSFLCLHFLVLMCPPKMRSPWRHVWSLVNTTPENVRNEEREKTEAKSEAMRIRSCDCVQDLRNRFESTLLNSISDPVAALEVMVTVKILSAHAADEEYLDREDHRFIKVGLKSAGDPDNCLCSPVSIMCR